MQHNNPDVRIKIKWLLDELHLNCLWKGNFLPQRGKRDGAPSTIYGISDDGGHQEGPPVLSPPLGLFLVAQGALTAPDLQPWFRRGHSEPMNLRGHLLFLIVLVLLGVSCQSTSPFLQEGSGFSTLQLKLTRDGYRNQLLQPPQTAGVGVGGRRDWEPQIPP